MTGWLIALGIIAAIALLPVGASVRYDETGPQAKLIIGPVKILLFPRPAKEKQKDEKPADETRKASASTAETPLREGPPVGAPANPNPRSKEKKGGSLTDFLPLLDVALDMLSSLRCKLRVNYLQLRLTMAADDPCDLAVNYGRAQAAGATLMAQLNRLLVIKKQDVQIQCDFATDAMKILARLDLTITVGRVLSLGAVYGVRALTTLLKIKNQRQGGAAL